MNYFNEALRVSNALVRYVYILARKVDVFFLVFVFLCVFGIKPIYKPFIIINHFKKKLLGKSNT